MALAMFAFAFLYHQQYRFEGNKAQSKKDDSDLQLIDESTSWKFRMHKRGQFSGHADSDIDGVLQLKINNTHVSGELRVRDPKSGLLPDAGQELTIGWIHGKRIQFNTPLSSGQPLRWSHYSGTILTPQLIKGEVTSVQNRRSAKGRMEMVKNIVGDWEAIAISGQPGK